jgi:cell division septum initiation protein DivIVA
MPDQSSAASEHALIQEITAPLATLPDDPVSLAADVDFPIVLRGYDRLAVDAYVRRTSQLVAELQATRSPEAAVRRALERVGGEITGILQRAHETAEDITARSRSEAEDRLEMARREAVELVASAERRVRELDDETERIWAERHRIVDDTRDLAAQLLALAHSAAERFPADEEDTASEEEPVAGEKPVAAAEPRAAFEPAVEPLDDTGEPTLESEPDVDATARLPRLPDGEEDTLEDTR